MQPQIFTFDEVLTIAETEYPLDAEQRLFDAVATNSVFTVGSSDNRTSFYPIGDGAEWTCW